MKTTLLIGLMGVMGMMLVACKPRVDEVRQKESLEGVKALARAITHDRYEAAAGDNASNALAAVDYQTHLTAFAAAKKDAATAGASSQRISSAAVEGRDDEIEIQRMIINGISGTEKKKEALDRLATSEP